MLMVISAVTFNCMAIFVLLTMFEFSKFRECIYQGTPLMEILYHGYVMYVATKKEILSPVLLSVSKILYNLNKDLYY